MLTRAICAIFSSLQAILKEILAIENFALFVEFRVFKIEFLQNHSVHRAQVSRDNWNCYALLFYYPYQIMMSNVNEAKTVNKDLPIQWNLYEADTLGECCSVRLIQGVRLLQVSIDNVIWGVKCHSNEQWKRLEYSQRLWRYTFALISLLKWTNWS